MYNFILVSFTSRDEQSDDCLTLIEADKCRIINYITSLD